MIKTLRGLFFFVIRDIYKLYYEKRNRSRIAIYKLRWT